MLFFSKGESEYLYNLWSSDLNTIIYINKANLFPDLESLACSAIYVKWSDWSKKKLKCSEGAT